MTENTQSRTPAAIDVIWQAMKTWYDDWFNLFVLNFFASISWMTIIFGPPLLFALYEIGHDLAHGRSQGVIELFRAAKKHFWVSWQWMIINVLVGIVLWVNITFYWRMNQWWSIILVSVFLFLGLFWAMTQFYVIPFYLEQSERSLKLAHKNAALTFLASPGYSLVMFLYAAVIFLLSFGIILPLILGGPSLVVVTGSYAVRERLQAFQARQS